MSCKRQAIVDALEAALKTVTKTNGYSSDLGKKVFIWRKAALGPNELPCINLRDESAKMSFDGAPMGLVNNELAVAVEAFFTGTTTASQARAALADIVACIGSSNRLGGLALEIYLRDTEIDLQQADIIAGACSCEFEIIYRTEQFKI